MQETYQIVVMMQFNEMSLSYGDDNKEDEDETSDSNKYDDEDYYLAH